jgi:hypothetical protein
MRSSLVLAALVVLAAFSGCPRSGAPTQPPPTPSPGTGYQGGVADGSPCDINNDCASGVCEGQGCGVGAGVCAAAERACTKDLRQYCGCDGATFSASGSCPGRRFAEPGACGAVSGKPDGAACLAASDCANGVCEGLGCGDDAPGVCVSAERMCTTDVASYCGCDGKTFTSSGSCAGQRYASRGACASMARAVGESCLAATDCASGVCEGQGCGADAPGVCAPASRGCTRDSRSYCGCDGQTFRASGSCPGRRFATKGACASAP